MSDFYSYEKMTDQFKKLATDEVIAKKLNKLKWVVTEKVHGANFSFVFKGGEIRYAKRKEYLELTDDFFAFQVMLEKYERKIINLLSFLQQSLKFDSATVYGELFGGEYPHPSIKKDDRLQAIQTGVYYAPGIEFYAFDIAIEDLEGNRYYLDYQDAINYFEQAELLYARPIFTGNLNEVLTYNSEFSSTIPSLLNLPPIEAPNIAEGIVIKPLRHLEVMDKSIRPILKIKNNQFLEDERYHEAQKWSFIPDRDNLTIELVLPEIMKFVTLNRLHAVISKIGNPGNEDHKKLQQIKSLMLEDVYESFIENYGELLSDFSNAERERLHEKLSLSIDQIITKSL